jgi:hypothetical protein
MSCCRYRVEEIVRHLPRCQSHEHPMEAEALGWFKRYGEDEVKPLQSRAFIQYDVAAFRLTEYLPSSTVCEIVYKSGESEVPVKWTRLEGPRQRRATSG